MSRRITLTIDMLVFDEQNLEKRVEIMKKNFIEEYKWGANVEKFECKIHPKEEEEWTWEKEQWDRYHNFIPEGIAPKEGKTYIVK